MVKITDEQAHEMYCEYLDEVYGIIIVGACEWWASHILEEMDPIGFRCGFADYVDGISEDYEVEGWE